MQHDQSVNEPNAKGKQAVTNNGATTSIGASARVGTGTGVGAGIGAGVVKTTATATGTTGNAPITNASISSPSTSSYSSWTVPSLDNLARRAINARYGLMGSRSATLVPSKISPTPSGMSVMMEGGAHGISIQNKARKMSLRMSDTITSLLNDTSLTLYRVNEHIHKKVPQFVEEKKALVVIHKNLDMANQDLEDARQTISGMQRITELGAIEELVKRALIAVK